MLQSAVFAQLAGIKISRRIMLFPNVRKSVKEFSTHMSTRYLNPMAVHRKKAEETLMLLEPEEKHWFTGGVRSSAVAVNILNKAEVIALPTDTIYGFAALAQNNEAIDKLYEIKGRERTKPLAITLGHVDEIIHWAETDHLPSRLLGNLLPGPVTVVLKRKPSLNPALNPGHETVGIRVPDAKFIRYLCKVIGQPLALTSANVSNQPSSLHPDEFAPLWPKLGAIFYDINNHLKLDNTRRVGSTVVDLTVPGEYEILREGVQSWREIHILRECGVINRKEKMNNDSDDLLREHGDGVDVK